MKRNTYLYLGQNVVVPKKSVVAVFDLDNASTSRITREFLAAAQRGGQIADVSGELPKSFVLTAEGGRRKCYLSQLNSSTLLRRWESPLLDDPHE